MSVSQRTAQRRGPVSSLSRRIGMRRTGRRSLRVWTIQPEGVWEKLQQVGVLHVDPEQLPYSCYVPPSYTWLTRQLRRRVSGWEGGLPWWVYCERPDLRQFRHYRPWGSREVRLEIEPSTSISVTFPVWAWNLVYTRELLATSRDEAERWYRRLRIAVPDEDTWPLPEPWNGELEASWERLFDPRLPRTHWDPEALGSKGEREGVLNCLCLEDVRNVTPFTGCDRKGTGLGGARLHLESAGQT